MLALDIVVQQVTILSYQYKIDSPLAMCVVVTKCQSLWSFDCLWLPTISFALLLCANNTENTENRIECNYGIPLFWSVLVLFQYTARMELDVHVFTPPVVKSVSSIDVTLVLFHR